MRKKTKNWHGGYGLQVLLLMLLLLVGGGSPAWAYPVNTEKTLEDRGGGTCKGELEQSSRSRLSE